MLPSIEDPLAPHLDRLSSAPETDPCGKFGLMHETLLKFENDRRYLNDMRYVRLWLEYASFFADPRWVYAHMRSKSIGVYIGAVYEQMAEYYIVRQRWKDADRVLCQGIDSRAEPAAKLQHRLHQVRHRVFQENQAIQAAADLAKEVPQHILRLFDWIHARLSYEGRRAMIKECFVYTHEETSFEEIRARRWKKDRNQNVIAARHATGPSDRHQLRPPPPPTKTSIRPALGRNDRSPDLVVGIPHEPAVEERILAKLRPSLASYSGFHNVSHMDHRPRVTKRKIQLCSETFTVIRKLGQGGMASVYELTRDRDGNHYAAKIESPPNPWEFYISSQVGDRTPHISLEVHAFYLYGNTSILLMDVASNGTLLDALNAYRSAHKVAAMPEPLVISFARQLVAALGELHNAGIIHGDLKIDNVVIVDQEGGRQRIGLIDFGRAVDLRMLPENCRLEPRWPIGSSDPPVPPPWNPWLVDKWGLAGILHMLLFGKAMETFTRPPSGPQQQQKRWAIRERLRRYWQQETWETVFDELLNNSRQGVGDAAAALSMPPQRNNQKTTAGLTKIY